MEPARACQMVGLARSRAGRARLVPWVWARRRGSRVCVWVRVGTADVGLRRYRGRGLGERAWQRELGGRACVELAHADVARRGGVGGGQTAWGGARLAGRGAGAHVGTEQVGCRPLAGRHASVGTGVHFRP